MTRTAAQSNYRILVIDDNPSIHDDFRKILAGSAAENRSLEEAKAALFGAPAAAAERRSFAIDSAFQGEEGLALVRRALEAGQPYALAFVDVRMPPGWDGVETIAHLWKHCPDLQVVICTAFSDYPWEDMIRKIGISANMVILKKPFDNIEVLQLAHALTEKWLLNEQVRAQLSHLDQLVRQRTAELEAANEQLRREIAERALVEQALRQSQKMEAVGQLAAGVAHDFNNILTIILGHVSLLFESTTSVANRESLTEIRNSAERATSLIRQLLAFSRKQVIQSAPLGLGEIITNLGGVLRRVLSENIALHVQAAAGLPLVEADLRMMEQAVINLAVNARDAMPQGGSLILTVMEVEIGSDAARRNPEARPGRHICLSVADTGCGISPESLPRIFEPFFTTKDVGKGTGLGLATVYGIVKQHGGWIEVQSTPGQGTVFRLFFPVCSEQEICQAERAASEPLLGGNESILVVEDEAGVRRLAADILKRSGYLVFEAESGVEALQMFQEPTARPIELLLTDMVMPGGVSGRDLAMRILTQNPALKVVYMTGYSRDVAGVGFRPFEEINLLTKPFSGPDLLRMVRRCLDEVPEPKPTVPPKTA